VARWSVFGESVLGASHRRRGRPNQDALGFRPDGGVGAEVILALADGHGSSRCFRSHDGARLAVAVAKGVFGEYLADGALGGVADGPGLLPTAGPELGRRWAAAVRRDLEECPVTDEEWGRLEEAAGAEARRLVESNDLYPYGATCLVVVVTEGFIAYAQLGDGEIVTVSPEGQVSRPLADDPKLFAGETTSLSREGDWESFRVAVQTPPEPAPALIVASTDGYSDSFPEVPNPLGDFAADIWKLIGAHGLAKVKGALAGWLADTTEHGSGDDITMGIISQLAAARGG
jgi:hypothetical protein